MPFKSYTKAGGKLEYEHLKHHLTNRCHGCGIVIFANDRKRINHKAMDVCPTCYSVLVDYPVFAYRNHQHLWIKLSQHYCKKEQWPQYRFAHFMCMANGSGSSVKKQVDAAIGADWRFSLDRIARLCYGEDSGIKRVPVWFDDILQTGRATNPYLFPLDELEKIDPETHNSTHGS